MKIKQTDIAVVGAGSAGLSAAYQAAAAGARVLVLDENRLPGPPGGHPGVHDRPSAAGARGE